MAAFHPETIHLHQRNLIDLAAQHKRDLNRRSKLPNNSKSLMAIRLSNRIGEAVQVMRDLERLIAFMEGVNQLREAAPSLAELIGAPEPYDPADLGPEYGDGYPLPGEPESETGR